MKKNTIGKHLLFPSMAVLACLILAVSVIRQSHLQVANKLGNASPSPVLTVPLQLVDKVPLHSSYQLPRPDILPTHPFYVLKMMGDRIKLLAAPNPTTKATLLLEYANIRIASAETLARQGNTDVAISTATKAEIYLLQAIEAGPSIPTNLQAQWYETLKQAVLKHEEVIERIHIIGTETSRNQTAAMHQNLSLLRLKIVSLSGQPFSYLRPEDRIPAEEIITPLASPSASSELPSM